MRRETTLRKLPLLLEPATVDPHDRAGLDWADAAVADHRLRLVITSCHRVPGRAELPERLDSVLTAVHLLSAPATRPARGHPGTCARSWRGSRGRPRRWGPAQPAIHADLLRRLGAAAGAARSYWRAMEPAANAAERAIPEQRLAEVSPAAGTEPAPG